MTAEKGGSNEKRRGEAAYLFNRAGSVFFRCCLPGAGKAKGSIESECEHKNFGGDQAINIPRCGWLQAGVARVHNEMQTDSSKHLGV